MKFCHPARSLGKVFIDFSGQIQKCLLNYWGAINTEMLLLNFGKGYKASDIHNTVVFTTGEEQ